MSLCEYSGVEIMLQANPALIDHHRVEDGANSLHIAVLKDKIDIVCLLASVVRIIVARNQWMYLFSYQPSRHHYVRSSTVYHSEM